MKFSPSLSVKIRYDIIRSRSSPGLGSRMSKILSPTPETEWVNTDVTVTERDPDEHISETGLADGSPPIRPLISFAQA